MCDSCDQYVQKALKEIEDVRGASFAKQVDMFAKLLDDYRPRALKRALAELDDNHRETITKRTIPDLDVFEDDVINRLVISYKLGQKYQEKNVQTQLAIDLSFAINSDDALERAKGHAGKLIKGIDEITQAEVSEIITNGISNSKSIKTVAKEIADKFDQYKGYRSQLIAQMETTNAFTAGKDKQFNKYRQELGVPGWKKVLTQGDAKVRPGHAENASLGWIPYDKEFPNGDLNRMREPFDYMCRCVTMDSIFNPDTDSIF